MSSLQDTGDASNAKKKPCSKPRSKPKVQENVNVQQMAQSDQVKCPLELKSPVF